MATRETPVAVIVPFGPSSIWIYTGHLIGLGLPVANILSGHTEVRRATGSSGVSKQRLRILWNTLKYIIADWLDQFWLVVMLFTLLVIHKVIAISDGSIPFPLLVVTKLLEGLMFTIGAALICLRVITFAWKHGEEILAEAEISEP